MKLTYAAAAGIVCVAATVAFADIKIAYVNFEKVFNEYYKTKQDNGRLQKLQEEKEQKGSGMFNDLNKLKSEVELLAGEAKEKKEGDIKKAIKELKEYTEASRRELITERNKMWKEIYEELKQKIAVKAEADGYTMVIDDKALVYKQKDMDITDLIITYVNSDAPDGKSK